MPPIILKVRMNKSGQVLRSMTGFSTTEGTFNGQSIRIEIKTLNHRFLDIKTRFPREFSSIEVPFRTALQEQISRGSIEIKIERVVKDPITALPLQINIPLLEKYNETLSKLNHQLGIKDPIRMSDLLSLPDIFSTPSVIEDNTQMWNQFSPIAIKAIQNLIEMREKEGAILAQALKTTLQELEHSIQQIRSQRLAWETEKRKKISDKIKAVFESYPIAQTTLQTVLEARIAQELAIILERTDIEEELTRFEGHLVHFKNVLSTGGLVGRKLDFILQELSREINTLGNKATDFMISEEVVRDKVRLEQLREQVMNLE